MRRASISSSVTFVTIIRGEATDGSCMNASRSNTCWPLMLRTKRPSTSMASVLANTVVNARFFTVRLVELAMLSKAFPEMPRSAMELTSTVAVHVMVSRRVFQYSQPLDPTTTSIVPPTRICCVVPTSSQPSLSETRSARAHWWTNISLVGVMTFPLPPMNFSKTGSTSVLSGQCTITEPPFAASSQTGTVSLCL